jgi:hypothetical protein
MSIDHESLDPEERNRRYVAELNELAGAVTWAYKPFLHFPAGMWKVGAEWDRAYYEAARYIISGVCEGHLSRFVHGAAGVFLFRHYVELALKYVLFYSRWLEDHSTNAAAIRTFKKTHDLNWLWSQIKAEVPAKLGGGAWSGFDTAFIDDLVRDLHRADPGSYGFRYNGETFGIEPRGVVDELAVDYEALLLQIGHVFNVLHSMQAYLLEIHGANADWQAEMNSW